MTARREALDERCLAAGRGWGRFEIRALQMAPKLLLPVPTTHGSRRGLGEQQGGRLGCRAIQAD